MTGGGPVRLRAHHLLCLLTYRGAGYTPAFTDNFDALTVRLNTDGRGILVSGPDDICDGWRDHPDCHCRRPSITARDTTAASLTAPVLGQALVPGAEIHLTTDVVSRLRRAYAAGDFRSACTGCEWLEFCGDIAAHGFSGTRLNGAVPASDG